ncbi:hypothetical protein LBMAG46_07380 [Planctomycetia bacterium]|nr:hypothetical protein LBMAG46_07380 [Planctomycetia bacterium]
MDFVRNVKQEVCDGVNFKIFQQQGALGADTAEELNGGLQSRVFRGSGELRLCSVAGHILTEPVRWFGMRKTGGILACRGI